MRGRRRGMGKEEGVCDGVGHDAEEREDAPCP